MITLTRYLAGRLFLTSIGVVLAFPTGLAGLYKSHVKPCFSRRKSFARPAASAGESGQRRQEAHRRA